MPNPIKHLQHRIKKSRREAELNRLRQHDSAVVRQVFAAFEQAVSGEFDTEATAWMERIESVRQRVLADRERTVSAIDYGAGQPEESRTIDVSENGVEYTRSVAEICEQGNVSKFERDLLFALIRNCKPEKAVELGTSLGFSASYQAAAMQLNGTGKIITLDGDEAVTKIAAGHHEELGLRDRTEIVVGRFSDTLQSVLQREGPIGFSFIDGHHDGDATLAYFEDFRPHLTEPAVLVFDDIHWYDSMKRAWNTLAQSPHVIVALELEVVGICVVTSEEVTPSFYRLKH